MSTDPREFEHPIDGTTPNELPTVLGVGSLTPEAIEAAARALFDDNPVWHLVHDRPALWSEVIESAKDRYRQQARAALTAAAPLTEANALRDAAEYAVANIAIWDGNATLTDVSTEETYDDTATWLRARAATIDRESFIATAMGDPEGRHLAAAAVALANAERKDS